MKEYFYYCNNCFRVEHIAVRDCTILNFRLGCYCGYPMNITVRRTGWMG